MKTEAEIREILRELTALRKAATIDIPNHLARLDLFGATETTRLESSFHGAVIALEWILGIGKPPARCRDLDMLEETIAKYEHEHGKL